MKKYLLCLVFFPFFVFAFDSVSECDKVIDSLLAERFRLRSLPVVVYRDKDDLYSNFSKRLRVVYLNRVYSPYDKNCSLPEWSELNRQAVEYALALSRIAEIDNELQAVKLERKQLLKNKRSRAAKVVNDCGVPRN